MFPTASKFRLPEDGNLPIIMVGPGTGVAPFRAFLQERQAIGARGKTWLFFGSQREKSDFYYKADFEKFMADGILTRLDTAFSRDQAHKIYVQDRMMGASGELWKWLEEGAHFYVCGDARRMAKDVDAALRQIVQQESGKNAEASKRIRRKAEERKTLQARRVLKRGVIKCTPRDELPFRSPNDSAAQKKERYASLEDNRPALGHHQHFFLHAVGPRAGEQPLRRLVHRFVAEAEGAVMHRHQFPRTELEKCAHRFLRIHVHFAFARRVIGADRQERDLDRKSLSDFLKTGKVGAVTAVKNRAIVALDNKAAEATMLIVPTSARPSGDRA